MLARLLPFLVLAVVALAPQRPAPAAASGTGLVIGRVIDGVSGAPIADVTVVLEGPLSAAVLVDSKGRFVFRNVPAGRFSLYALKSGYGSGNFGKLRVDGPSTPLDLSDGEHVTDAVLRMWPSGSISGRVLDEAGEPVVGAYVWAYKRVIAGGRPALGPAYDDLGTDDRGSYRIPYLTPGDYVIVVSSRVESFPASFVEADAAVQDPEARQARSAELTAKNGANRMGGSPSSAAVRILDSQVLQADGRNMPLTLVNGRLWVNPSTFYPAARTVGAASVITIGSGEHRSGIDVHLTMAPTVRVAGIATGPNGPVANLAVRLSLPPEDLQVVRSIADTVTDARGGFSFFGVVSGRYLLTTGITVSMRDSPDLIAEVPVTVGDQDISNLAVTLRPMTRVTGRIAFDGTSPQPPPAQYRTLGLTIEPADGRPLRSALAVDQSGNMSSPGLAPGKYFVRLLTPALRGSGPGVTWTLKSAMVGGRDVSDVPLVVDGNDVTGLVVTFTDHAQMLSGSVRDAQGAPDSTASVLVFPVDRTWWVDYGRVPRRLRNVRADRTGAFTTSGLPDGEYFVIAIPDASAGAWPDPVFLQRAAAQATRLRIDGGANASIDLRTVRW